MLASRISRWTPQEDALFRRMAEANVRPEIIAAKLNRSVHAIKLRAYTIGLPLKWFRGKEPPTTLPKPLKAAISRASWTARTAQGRRNRQIIA